MCGHSMRCILNKYIAAAEAAKSVIALRRLLGEIGATQSKPTPLLMDNQTAIRMALVESQQGRRKHIDVKHHKIVELNGKELSCQWVSTVDELADLLTKALPQRVFDHLRDIILGRVESEIGSD